MKLPSYLRKTKFNTSVFRRRIPKHLLPLFTTDEIRISLSKLSTPLTIMYSRVLAFEAENLFYRLENNLSISETPSVLMRLVRHKKELMSKDEKYTELENLMFKFAGEQTKQRQMLQERHRSEIGILTKIIESKLEKPAKTLKKSILLSEAIDLFLAPAAIARRKDKLATVRKHRDTLKLFLKIVGDKPMSEVTQDDASKFADAAATFDCKRGETRAESTVNGFMNSVSRFSNWFRAFHKKEGHEKLDFSELRFKRTKAESEDREAFTIEEVKLILSHPKLIANREVDPPKFWLPHIAAYSGARLEEISQLNPSSDVYLEDDIWVIDINGRDGKSVKNKSSVRKVPIHSELIKLGFLDYVNSIKGKSETLFIGEKIRDGRIGKNSGKRVNRMICELLGTTGKTLHSFRHSFATFLKRRHVEEAITAAIMGHEHGGITYKRYGKDYLSEAFKPNIEKIIYIK